MGAIVTGLCPLSGASSWQIASGSADAFAKGTARSLFLKFIFHRFHICYFRVFGGSHCPYLKLDPDASAARYPYQTSTIPYDTIPCHAMSCHTIPYHTIPYHTILPLSLLLLLSCLVLVTMCEPLLHEQVAQMAAVRPQPHRRIQAQSPRESGPDRELEVLIPHVGASITSSMALSSKKG